MTGAMDQTGLQEVPVAPPLRIRYLPGWSKRLVISFSGVGTDRQVEPGPEFYRIAGWNGENHVLFVTDSSRSWMNGPGMAESIVAVVKDYVARIGAGPVMALGNSMGGTMALILSRLMPLDVVVAVVPQYSVHPEIVPEETRWQLFRKQIADYRFREVGALPLGPTQYCILHGGTADEIAHARHFAKQGNVHHFVIADQGHRLAQHLQTDQKLTQIVTDFMQGRYFRVRRTVRAAGGTSLARFLSGDRSAERAEELV